MKDQTELLRKCLSSRDTSVGLNTPEFLEWIVVVLLARGAHRNEHFIKDLKRIAEEMRLALKATETPENLERSTLCELTTAI